MVRDAAARVTNFLRDRLGDGLRTVAVVTPDGYQVTYIADTLDKQYSDEAYAEVIDSLRLERPFLSPLIEDFPIGERRAVLHYHENAFVLQFPFSDTESILISMSPEVGSDLLDFIETCRRMVQEEPVF